MNQAAKIFTVITTFICLFFLGLIVVTAYSGRNWNAMAEELTDYSIEKSEGEVVSYSTIHRQTGTNLGSTSSLPGAIISAYKDKQNRLRARSTEIQDEIARIEPQIEQVKKFSEVDDVGIDDRIGRLQTSLKDLNEKTVEAAASQASLAAKAQTVREDVERRRADIARLQNALAEIRTERFRLEEQIKELDDRLIRLEGAINRAEGRREQLKTQTSPGT
ncbi:hypothetical protein [Calycomorphotria hydatis]|uniref:Chromosome partition protein Smc n=1 Tax=Calycomorphotria hydatis TaxID=2528027 RepID=A0A517TAX8_9PLAN|nr:hypothetical protein [Calycomorphotria hydatis]QDT65525.1 Chromosome partition protein Smc [Calycomorphotria hydatis]